MCTEDVDGLHISTDDIAVRTDAHGRTSDDFDDDCGDFAFMTCGAFALRNCRAVDLYMDRAYGYVATTSVYQTPHRGK